MPMKLTSVSITEKPTYLQKDGEPRYHAKCTVQGEYPHNAGITVDIPDEALAPIVDIMQQLVAQSMADAAAKFAADVQASIGSVTIDQPAIAAPTA